MRKVILVPAVIGALGAVSVNFKEVHEANRREREVGSYPENSIVGDSKDTKESNDLAPVLTCCNPLPRTINQAKHPAWVYKEWT